MSDTLRDQLLGLGFKPVPTPVRERKPGPNRPTDKGGRKADASRRPDAAAGRRQTTAPGGKPRKGGPARTREDIDLAKAYAIRAQKEKDERIAAERQRQEEARLRREARAKLEEFLKGRTLNDPDADIARHFPYGGKIKRIYVNADQLRALNAGELGVAQLNGRYLLVSAADLAQVEAMFAAAVALRVDPGAPAEDDPYQDPKFQVPDDLVW